MRGSPHGLRGQPYVMGRQPHATGRQPHATGRQPHATGRQPHATGGQPHVTGGQPHVTGDNPTQRGGSPTSCGTPFYLQNYPAFYGAAVKSRLDKGFKIRYTFNMLFPLKELIEYDDNMYEITIAASRRAYQLQTLMDKDEKEYYDGKIAALAARQVFTQEVQFRLEAE